MLCPLVLERSGYLGLGYVWWKIGGNGQNGLLGPVWGLSVFVRVCLGYVGKVFDSSNMPKISS